MPPVPMSRMNTVNGSLASPTTAADPKNPQIEVMPAMNTASAMPDTLRHARFGLSRIRRMAIIVAASLGCLAFALARAVTTHEPTRFTSAKHSSTNPRITAYITACPACASTAGFLNTNMATTMTTVNSTTRAPEGKAAAARDVTPSGVITTRRKVTSDEISASTATPASVTIRANAPTHNCSKVKRCSWNGISMTAGISAQ